MVMSVFDRITSDVEAAAKQASLPAGLHEHLTAMLNDPKTGGLQGLVQKFQAGGLGGIIASWIGTGPNQPITPQQIQSVLGSDNVQKIAGRLGMSPDALSAALATGLPVVIDRLTPNGQIPPATPTPAPAK